MYLFPVLDQLNFTALGVHEFDVWCMGAGLSQSQSFHFAARLRINLVSHVMPKPWIQGQSLEIYFSSSFTALSYCVQVHSALIRNKEEIRNKKGMFSEYLYVWTVTSAPRNIIYYCSLVKNSDLSASTKAHYFNYL
jgi:hypothetical protein